MSGIATTCLSCLSAIDRWCHITACLGGGRSRDGIYETTLADNEREAVSDLLGYLENVRRFAFVSFRRRPT
jgi:vacuolar protein 8